jgi:hypothetical protein
VGEIRADFDDIAMYDGTVYIRFLGGSGYQHCHVCITNYVSRTGVKQVFAGFA